MGAGLWLLLLASLVLMGVFSHLAYGAGLARVLTGLATTLAILAAVLAVAYASTRDRGRSQRR